MEDYGADLRLGTTNYAYVDGAFQIDLPVGDVFCEVVKGLEYRPLRERVVVAPGQSEIVLHLERPLNFRRDGWITADTHVHFVPPSTALLEARAEGVNIVNVLATQWGNLFTNITDFLASPLIDFDHEAGVWVGTENRQPVLGHVGLLNPGAPLFPLCTGGAPTSGLGEPVTSLMADWADRCHAVGGLVVSAHFPFPYGEIAADVVSGKIDAVEMFNFASSLSGPRIRDWYRFLNSGYRIPIVGGTDKMSAGTPIGAVRTYAQLEPDDAFGFDSWARAVRAGRTFATSGPLLRLQVEGHGPGSTIRLSETGGDVAVEVIAQGVNPLHELEVVVNGVPVASAVAPDGTRSLRISERVRIDGTSWFAARSTSKYAIRMAFPTAVASHTSPVYIECGEQPLVLKEDAAVLLTMISGGLEWIQSIALVDNEADRRRFADFFRLAHEALSRRATSASC
jgi:hypothetical protein